MIYVVERFNRTVNCFQMEGMFRCSDRATFACETWFNLEDANTPNNKLLCWRVLGVESGKKYFEMFTEERGERPPDAHHSFFNVIVVFTNEKELPSELTLEERISALERFVCSIVQPSYNKEQGE